jgi:secretion/DNA translocation related TadE-like protein
MAISSSRQSRRDLRYCREWRFRQKRWRRSSRDEAGSASLLAVAMIAVLVAVTAGGVYLGSAVVARHRAQAAADLAALAAAVRLAEGSAVACERAAAVARAMRAVVADCVVDDLDVVVTVEVGVSLGRIALAPARAAARAGPVGTAD